MVLVVATRQADVLDLAPLGRYIPTPDKPLLGADKSDAFEAFHRYWPFAMGAFGFPLLCYMEGCSAVCKLFSACWHGLIFR